MFIENVEQRKYTTPAGSHVLIKLIFLYTCKPAGFGVICRNKIPIFNQCSSGFALMLFKAAGADLQSAPLNIVSAIHPDDYIHITCLQFVSDSQNCKGVKLNIMTELC